MQLALHHVSFSNQFHFEYEHKMKTYVMNICAGRLLIAAVLLCFYCCSCASMHDKSEGTL